MFFFFKIKGCTFVFILDNYCVFLHIITPYFLCFLLCSQSCLFTLWGDVLNEAVPVLALSESKCLFHMVTTQIFHPTPSPPISTFDRHTLCFFFLLPSTSSRLFLMLLALPVCLCDNQEPATLSMFATAFLNPLFLSVSFSVTG